MKKILALVIAAIMMFSIAAVPASAAVDTNAVSDSYQEVVDSFNAGDYEATIFGVIDLAKDLVVAIHELVGGILGVLAKDCPFCEEIHTVEIAPAA